MLAWLVALALPVMRGRLDDMTRCYVDDLSIPVAQAFWSQDTPAALLIEACPGALHMELHPVGYGVIDPFTIGSGTCP
jgi:hypothetical protein